MVRNEGSVSGGAGADREVVITLRVMHGRHAERDHYGIRDGF